MREVSTKAKRALAAYFLKDERGDAPVAWALVLLEEGFDSQNLRILAGLGTDAHWQDMDFYFAQARQDLQMDLPNAEETILLYAAEIAKEMLSGTISLKGGCGILNRLYESSCYMDVFSDWIWLDEKTDWIEDTAAWEVEVRAKAADLITMAEQCDNPPVAVPKEA